MEKVKIRKIFDDLVWLSYCAVNKVKPDAEHIKDIDINLLFKAAQHHQLTAVTAYALESAGIYNPSFTQAKAKAMRKVGLMDAEMADLFRRMDDLGIWHMPLKGTVLKDYYPSFGMREMSDHDILMDETRTAEVRDILKGMGFKSEHFGEGNHDCYYKEPVCNFEIHRKLFGAFSDERMQEYYVDVNKRLIKDDNTGYGYHLSDEDFYIYLTAHEYKHFSAGGTGIRSLLDCYIYLKVKKDSLDFTYITGEMKKLGIAGFERKRKKLAIKIFTNGKSDDVKFFNTDWLDSKLTEDERKLLDYYYFSGTYGNEDNSIRHKIENVYRKAGKKSKWAYFRERVLPDLKTMTYKVPIVKNRPWMYPVGFAIRFYNGCTSKRKLLIKEYKMLKKVGK